MFLDRWRACAPARRARFRRGSTVAILAAAAFAAPAFAGGGSFNNDGTIDFTLNFRFPPNQGTIDLLKTRITDASHRLWDSSDGQIRFGTVTFTCTRVNEDLADVWLYPQEGRATSGSGISIPGKHINLYTDDAGTTIAHEFGHLALELGDEYSEQKRFGKCYGIGPCIDTGDDTTQNQCLMQSSSWTEFCTDGRHDLLQGNNAACLVNPPDANGAPCSDKCELWNIDTLRYETTSHTTSHDGKSCWESLVEKFPFLTAPADLPTAAEPGSWVAPVFVDNCGAANTVLLLLDRSGSMTYQVSSDDGEVCDNGKDDDGDGTVDETDDCKDARLEFVQAAARAFIDLSTNQGVRVGIVSFAEDPLADSNFVEVDGSAATALKDIVDDLNPGGCTAIGSALTYSKALFDLDTVDEDNKSILLLTDGFNTCGPEPSTVVDSLANDGIRVFTVPTGGASDDPGLVEISGETNGSHVDSRDATALVSAFVQQWAHYTNGGVIIPKLPYRVSWMATFSERQDDIRGAANWATGVKEDPVSPGGTFPPANNRMAFRVEPGTQRLSIVLAGNNDDMDGFGVQARLDAPAGPDFDSEVGHSSMRVVKDSFYLMVEISGPSVGDWTLEVRGIPGKGQIQTGNVTIISDNPRVDLFAALDQHVVTDPTRPVTLHLTPIYSTPLINLEWEVFVKRPDGVFLPVPVITDETTNEPTATIGGIGFNGIYEVRTLLRTTATSLNDPGESLFSDKPSNSVPVPLLERSAARYFFFTDPGGRWPCHSGNTADCDGDGVREPFDDCDKDTDRDGVPDCYDPDSDNDETPDSVEWIGTITDLDGDGIWDHLDPDADGDGIFDANDLRIATRGRGDVDDSGRFDIRDVVAALRRAGGLDIAYSGDVSVADTTSPRGVLTLHDALALLHDLPLKR